MQETNQPTPSNREAIAALAQQIWEKNGRPAGRDVEFWLQAERSVRSTVKPPAQAAAPVVSSMPAAQSSAAATTSIPKAKKPAAKAAKGSSRPSK
jgi:hypothetical protein